MDEKVIIEIEVVLQAIKRKIDAVLGRTYGLMATCCLWSAKKIYQITVDLSILFHFFPLFWAA